MGEPVEAPGHHLTPLVEETVISAVSYHGLLSQTQVAAFPSSGHRLSQALGDPADVIVNVHPLQLPDVG